jgi:hypothetical protein
VAGGASVPKPQARYAVGVNVLWCALKFGKNGKVMTSINSERVVNLKQCCFIALND